MTDAVQIGLFLRGCGRRLHAAHLAHLLVWGVDGRRARLAFLGAPQGGVAHAVGRLWLSNPNIAISLCWQKVLTTAESYSSKDQGAGLARSSADFDLMLATYSPLERHNWQTARRSRSRMWAPSLVNRHAQPWSQILETLMRSLLTSVTWNVECTGFTCPSPTVASIRKHACPSFGTRLPFPTPTPAYCQETR